MQNKEYMYMRTIIYVYVYTHDGGMTWGSEKKPLNLFSPTIVRQRYPFSVGRDLIRVYRCLCLFYYNSATRLHRVKNADTFTFLRAGLLLRFLTHVTTVLRLFVRVCTPSTYTRIIYVYSIHV